MYTRKGGNKMNRITIYRDWKIVRKLDIPDEIKKEINKVLVRLLIEKREKKVMRDRMKLLKEKYQDFFISN